MTAATPSAAQTGVETASPPAASASPAPSPPSGASASDLMSHFVATAIPTANFIATASRLAVAKSHNNKVQKFAEALAKKQTAIANSLASWVNVNGPVVTLRSPYTGQIGPGAAKLRAPNLLPAQVTNLQRLSASQGHDFDALFVSAQMEALVQLQTLYSDFIQNGTDPGLRAIATRELPKVEQTISALDSL
jgi:putative membrane protein